MAVILDKLSDFLFELLCRLRESANARLDDAAFEERVIGIGKATAALYESGIDDEEIIRLLQKYWDLRLSEAKDTLQKTKETI